VSLLVSDLKYSGVDIKEEREVQKMNKLNLLWAQHVTPNRKAFLVVLALVALAVAGGAPGASGGIGSL